MSFDGFFLHHMTAELREQVLYGRIQKVNQPFERELVQPSYDEEKIRQKT